MSCRTKVATANPVIFQCGCGETTRSPDQALPVGWSTHGGLSWCIDCTTAGVPARTMKRRA